MNLYEKIQNMSVGELNAFLYNVYCDGIKERDFLYSMLNLLEEVEEKDNES